MPESIAVKVTMAVAKVAVGVPERRQLVTALTATPSPAGKPGIEQLVSGDNPPVVPMVCE